MVSCFWVVMGFVCVGVAGSVIVFVDNKSVYAAIAAGIGGLLLLLGFGTKLYMRCAGNPWDEKPMFCDHCKKTTTSRVRKYEEVAKAATRVTGVCQVCHKTTTGLLKENKDYQSI